MREGRHFSGKLGRYIFCDICGQACYTFDAVKLATNTGKGGLIVCKKDADVLDPGLMPARLPVEKSPPWTRVNESAITDGSTILNYETTTSLGT